MNRALLPALLALSGCGVFFDQRTQLRFSGPLTATNPADCPPTRANLLIREQHVTFTPDEGTWIMQGDATATTLTANRSRPGADRKLFQTALKAEWTQTAVQGTYTTPRCTYRVDLKPY